jgi:hypothetical protein
MRAGGAIAAAAVLVGLIAGLTHLSSTSSKPRASSAGISAIVPASPATTLAPVPRQEAKLPSATNPGGQSPVALAPPEEPLPAPGLGSFANLPELVAALEALGPAQRSDALAQPSTSACVSPAAAAAGLAPGSRPDLEARLTFMGIPAEVFTFATVGRNTQTAVVVRASTCSVLAVTDF